jgi:Helix-turn-helix domain
MFAKEVQVEIQVLARQGKGIREIARFLKCSRKAVRRVLRGKPRRNGAPPGRLIRVAAIKLNAFSRILELARATSPSIRRSLGTLYGTTEDGGVNGDGTVFSITHPAKICGASRSTRALLARGARPALRRLLPR